MQYKTPLFISAAFLFIILVSAGAYFNRKTAPEANSPEGMIVTVESGAKATAQENGVGNTQGATGTAGAEDPKKNEMGAQKKETRFIDTADISIALPDGWMEASAPAGVSAMGVNFLLETSDPEAEKLNFRTYMAIGHDTLQGNTRDAYIESVKQALAGVSPATKFTHEGTLTVDSHDADAIEFELNQQGVDFKILMAFIWGDGDAVWTISFNTTKIAWNDYRDLFYRTIDTFRMK